MSQLNPTAGEKRVGWYFKKSGIDVADGIKTQCAALIDLLSNYKDLDPVATALAQQHFEDGCKEAMKLWFK